MLVATAHPCQLNPLHSALHPYVTLQRLLGAFSYSHRAGRWNNTVFAARRSDLSPLFPCSLSSLAPLGKPHRQLRRLLEEALS